MTSNLKVTLFRSIFVRTLSAFLSVFTKSSLGRDRMQRWNGRLAVVTGAANETGRAICRELLEYGLRVVACDDERNFALNRDLEETIPGVHIKACNMRKRVDMDKMFLQIREEFGSLHVGINNTDISNLEIFVPTDGDRVIIDFKILSDLLENEVSEMSAEDGGIIINIESLTRRVPQSNNAIRWRCINNSRSWVLTITQSMRLDLTNDSDKIQMWSIGMRNVDPASLLNDLYPSTADVIEEIVGILQRPPMAEEIERGEDIQFPRR